MDNSTEGLEGRDYNLEQADEVSVRAESPLRLPYLTASSIASSLGVMAGVLGIRASEQAVHIVDLAYKSAFLFVTHINPGPAYNPHLVTAESIVVPGLITVGICTTLGLIRDLNSHQGDLR